MNIDLQKAEGYYSNLPDSKLIECLNNRSEFDSEVITLVENTLLSRGTPEQFITNLRNQMPDVIPETHIIKSKYTWGIMFAAFASVIIVNAFLSDGIYYRGEPDFVAFFALCLGSVILPVLLVFVVRYFSKSKIDWKEIITFGCLITTLIMLLQWLLVFQFEL